MRKWSIVQRRIAFERWELWVDSPNCIQTWLPEEQVEWDEWLQSGLPLTSTGIGPLTDQHKLYPWFPLVQKSLLEWVQTIASVPVTCFSDLPFVCLGMPDLPVNRSVHSRKDRISFALTTYRDLFEHVGIRNQHGLADLCYQLEWVFGLIRAVSESQSTFYSDFLLWDAQWGWASESKLHAGEART